MYCTDALSLHMISPCTLNQLLLQASGFLAATCTTASHIPLIPKIVSEYDQEIQQSQTADKRKSNTTITRHQEDKLSKATSSLIPIKMIAKLEWTQSKNKT